MSTSKSSKLTIVNTAVSTFTLPNNEGKERVKWAGKLLPDNPYLHQGIIS